MNDGMWRRLLDNYCERAGDPGFWAEPLNAITNGAFIVAGVLLLGLIARDAAARREGGPRDPLSWMLALLILVIGVGSFLFHTLAYRWAAIADSTPILLFMLTGVFAVARRGFGAPWWGGLLAVAGFLALGLLAVRLRGLIADPSLARTLGGVFGYGPALLVLLVSGALMRFARDPARRAAGLDLALAGGVFALSLTFRTIDGPFCPWLTVGGVPIGSHFLWHLLNALTLYLTARGLIGLAPRVAASPRNGPIEGAARG